MNAPFTAYDALNVVRAYPSWAERWEAFRGNGYWRAALLTIAREAQADSPYQDNELATYCLDAAQTPYADERAEAIGEIERIFSEYDAAEKADHMAYIREVRGASSNPNSARWLA